MSRSVLRAALYPAGGVLVLCAVLLAIAGCTTAAAWLGGWSAALLVALAVEHWRYRPLADRRPGPDWIATAERFVDPETGRLVTVYHHPPTGERRYVAERREEDTV